MDTGLLQNDAQNQHGLLVLKPGGLLRLRNPAGRHLGVLRGVAWITQDGDIRDHIVGSGESFRFDRDGLALVMTLGVETKLILENGLAPEMAGGPDTPSANRIYSTDAERRARQIRTEAMARVFHNLAGLWRRALGRLFAASQSHRSARELRALNDRTLRDIGLRREEIDCVTKRAPCGA
jgi:uncharacterized protein YjiS (DUF1127 family)